MVSVFGRRISSPRRILFVRPVHPIVVPPCPILAGASPGRATIAYIGWRIPSPILAGASPRRATIAYIGWRIPSPIFRLALIVPKHAAYCTDSAKANPGYPLLLLIVAF